jgi:ATP-dependent Clp protease ATP-binding subunit ClpA
MYLLVQVHRHFKPEFLNRLSEVVIFEALSHGRLKEIVKIQMKSVIARVAAKSISLSASDAALDVILSESYNPVSVDSFQTNQMLFSYNQDFPDRCMFC